jgi:hypothetical protein
MKAVAIPPARSTHPIAAASIAQKPIFISRRETEMSELDEFSDNTLQVAEHLMFRTAIRALMLAHPNPSALRTSWNQTIAQTWSDYSENFGHLEREQASNLSAAMKICQEAFEGYIPAA